MRQLPEPRQSPGADFNRSLAVSALTFLAADEERLRRFLAVTGLGPHNLRSAAADPGFYGSVLDYLVADEQLLIGFAADAQVAPETVAKAQRALCGPSASGDP